MRKPAVAGQFYPIRTSSIEKQISSFIEEKKPEKVIGAVVPHAGYIYSGAVAGCVYAKLEPKPVYIILGPNHTGCGVRFSIMAEGWWEMPQGRVLIDAELAEGLLEHTQLLEEDEEAHRFEHSIEVQLPFLQYLKKPFKFVPIVVSYASLNEYKRLGEEIASSLMRLQKEAVIIASSDMTHYETQTDAKKKDQIAIKAILDLDEDKLFQCVEEYDISMCGFAPVCIMLSASKRLGAKTAELVKYQTSGDVSGDYSSVVGYAGIIVQ